MKKLKPSHRENKRYLLIKGKDANKKNIEEAILKYVGVLGYSEASPAIIKSSKNRAILAVNRKSLNKIRAGFLLCEKEMSVSRVSGSVKNFKQ
jgi:RNase P/RNase MRP subunit POP5